MKELLARTEGQLATRSNIDAIEAVMRAGIASGELEEVLHDGETEAGDDECDHFFAQGVYARGVLIPAGTAVVGKLHKQSRVCIVAKGDCQFTDEFHSERIQAPWVGEFKGGTKTAVYAHTDTYWVAVTGTDLKDPTEILQTLSAKDHAEYAEHIHRLAAGSSS